MPDHVRQDMGGECAPHVFASFFYAFNRLNKRWKGLFPSNLSKNIFKKSWRNACQFKIKAYLCTRNRENNDRLLSESETIFEDIYIIRQVVQESESSISREYRQEKDLGLR